MTENKILLSGSHMATITVGPDGNAVYGQVQVHSRRGTISCRGGEYSMAIEMGAADNTDIIAILVDLRRAIDEVLGQYYSNLQEG